MPVRPSWSGNLKLSLITIPVRMYRAVSSTARTGLNMLHEGCNQRIQYQYTCPLHGEVEKDDIVKGFQYEKGKYVVLDDETLQNIKIPTSKTLEIVQFVPREEIDPVYFDTAYYLAPDGPVSEEAFRVLREAMERAGKVAVGRVTMAGHEHVAAIMPEGKGLLLTTLHYGREVRSAAPYFAEMKEEKSSDEELDLARTLIDAKSKPFDPDAFRDRYEEALAEAIQARLQGREPQVVEVEEPGKIIDFMDALKRSIAQESEAAPKPHRKPPAARVDEPSRGRRKKEGG
jgi:DNA end-binding protein Ku